MVVYTLFLGVILLIVKITEHHLHGDLEWILYWIILLGATVIGTIRIDSAIKILVLNVLLHLLAAPFCFHRRFIIVNLQAIFLVAAIGATIGYIIVRHRRKNRPNKSS